MAKINLLPWRDAYRAEKQREFTVIIAGVCIIAALLVYIWVSMVRGDIDSQEARNQYLQNEISALESKVREIRELKKNRAELLSRMEVIQGLQGERPLIVRYFDELVRAVPEGVYLEKLERKGNTVDVAGVSESNVRVSAFMRNLNDSEWFDAPNLSSVKAAPKYGEQASEFTLSFDLSKAKESSDNDNEKQ